MVGHGVYISHASLNLKIVWKKRYNYLRGFSLFLKEEFFFFFFFNLRKQTLKAELKQLIDAIQYASANLKFRENKKLDYTLINRQ